MLIIGLFSVVFYLLLVAFVVYCLFFIWCPKQLVVIFHASFQITERLFLFWLLWLVIIVDCFLVVIDCYRLMLIVVDGCWFLFDCCWLLLIVVPWCWLVLWEANPQSHANNIESKKKNNNSNKSSSSSSLQRELSSNSWKIKPLFCKVGSQLLETSRCDSQK